MTSRAESRPADGPSRPSAGSGAVVGFDTATDDTVVGAWRDGELLYEAVRPPPEGGRPLHAEALLAEVERAAESAGGWSAVATVAVGTGPGSFTGLRIGIATARALGAALPVALRGVGTLDTLAAGVSGVGGGEVAAVIDGRRGEVFAAVYGAGGAPLTEPAVRSPRELASLLAGRGSAVLAVGSGALRFRGELVESGVEVPDAGDPVHRVGPRPLCTIAAAGRGSADLSPRYLRAPDAERWHERADLPTT